MSHNSRFSFYFSRLFLVSAAMTTLLLAGAGKARSMTCETAPSRIDIGLGYHGADLTVSGDKVSGEDLIVRITSPFEESHLKYKDKAAGIFWMKKGTMTFHSTPSVYMLFSTGELSKILDREEQDRYLLGYEALAGQADIESPGMKVDKKKWFSEFVKFKEKDHLYTVKEGAVTLTGGGGYQLKVEWPFQASPGDYEVEVFAVTGGEIVEKAASTLTVSRSGAVAWLSNLAFEHAPLYGIMAVIVAMASGSAVGVVFKGGGGH